MADFHITGDTKLDGSGFQSGLSAMTVAAGNLISKLISTVASATSDAASNIISTGMSFDTAMSQVAATMGTTVDQIQDISDKAKEMGATTKFTATEAAEGMNILAMAGLNASEQIAGISTVLDLASAGAMSLESSASYVTGTVKGFADSMDNAQYYADLMAKGATLANTDVSGLGDAMSTAAATASGYKQSAESVTLALLRLAEQNVTGSEAATALNRAMMDLYTPTDNAAAALEQLGISAYDSSGNARDFNDVVDELSAALSGMSDEEANALKNTIFTTYGLNAFNKMTVSSAEKVEEFKEGLAGASEEFDGAGAAAGQAATQLDNLEGDMTLLSSATDGLSLAFYNTFSDAARSVVQEGTSMVSDLTTALESDGIPGVLSSAQGMAASLISGFVDKVISEGPSAISSGAEIVANTLQGVATALPDVLNKGAELVSTLVSAIAAEVPALVQSGASMISGFVQGAGTILPDILDTGIELIGSLISAIAAEVPALVQNGVDTAANLINGLASGVAQAIPEFLGQALPMLMEFSGQLRENAGQMIDAGLNLIMQLVQGIADSLPVLIENVPTIVSNIAGIINDNAPKILEAGIEIIGTLVDGLIQAIPTLIDNIPQIIQAVVDTFTAFNWLNLGSNIITWIKDGVNGLATSLPEAMKNIGQEAKEWLSAIDWKTLGADIIDLIKIGIESLLTAIPDTLLSIGNKALDWFKSIDWLSVGTDLIEGIIAGINGSLDGLWTAAGDLCSGLLDSITGFFGINSPSTVMKEQGDYLVQGMINGLDSLPGEAASILANALSNVTSWGNDLAINGLNAAKSMLANVTTQLAQLPVGVSSIGKSSINGFISAIKGLLSSVKSAATSILTNMTSGIAQLPSKLLTIAQNAIKSIISAFTSGGWKNVGSNIVSGIASGITSGVSKIASAATDAASKALSAAKNFLGIHSPSRKARDEIGVQYGAGVALGIEQSSDEMVHSAQASAEDMVTAARGVVLEHQIQVSSSMATTGTVARYVAATAAATTEMPTTSNSNYGWSEKIDILIEEVEKIDALIEAVKEGKQLYLDTGKLVGATIKEFDAALGRRAVRLERGG